MVRGKQGGNMFEFVPGGLVGIFVFDCAVLAPFCRYAGLKAVSCFKWVAVCLVGQLLMSAT
jgi:hypothetical protein